METFHNSTMPTVLFFYSYKDKEKESHRFANGRKMAVAIA